MYIRFLAHLVEIYTQLSCIMSNMIWLQAVWLNPKLTLYGYPCFQTPPFVISCTLVVCKWYIKHTCGVQNGYLFAWDWENSIQNRFPTSLVQIIGLIVPSNSNECYLCPFLIMPWKAQPGLSPNLHSNYNKCIYVSETCLYFCSF